ncbi:MAG TPA: FlgD immunoglobulin-like domain containing protein, partial [Candidatus Saccharimonadia bacterium]
TMSVATLGVSSITAIGYQGTPGNYSNVQSNGNCTYSSVRAESPLDPNRMNDRCLNHEYGHAWSYYYGVEFQQDSKFTSYLKARGLDGDSRVNSSYQWYTAEMIAEDYRQLLGSPNTQDGQINWEIPFAKDVPGLKDYLLTAFRIRLVQPVDNQAPTAPANLQRANYSTNTVSLTWNASTDNTGVAGYELYRNGVQVANPIEPSFLDIGLTPGTEYSYVAIAYDAAGNHSAPSAALVTSTASNATPPPPTSNVVISNLLISPNPVVLSGKTNPIIKYSLSQSSIASVSITNSSDGLVRKLTTNLQQSGNLQLSWDRKDANGRKVRAGTYVVKVEATGSSGNPVTQMLTFRAK